LRAETAPWRVRERKWAFIGGGEPIGKRWRAIDSARNGQIPSYLAPRLLTTFRMF